MFDTKAKKRTYEPAYPPNSECVIDLTSDPDEPPSKKTKSKVQQSVGTKRAFSATNHHRPYEFAASARNVNKAVAQDEPNPSSTTIRKRLNLSTVDATTEELQEVNVTINGDRDVGKDFRRPFICTIPDDDSDAVGSSKHSTNAKARPSCSLTSTELLKHELVTSAVVKTPGFGSVPKVSSIRFDPTRSARDSINIQSRPHRALNSSIQCNTIPQPSVSLSSRERVVAQTIEQHLPTLLKPAPAKALTIDVPPTRSAIRQGWIDKLKADVNVMYRHREEIHQEDVLPGTGFASIYPTDEHEAIYKKVRQSKRRPPCNREQVRLDFGKLTLKHTEDTDQEPSKKASVKVLHPRKQAQDILVYRFASISPKLTFAENYSHKRINGKFQFVSSYVYRHGVATALRKRRQAPPVSRCDCAAGTCGVGCQCVQHPRRSDTDEGHAEISTYYYNPSGEVVLTDQFLQNWLVSRTEILECGEHCGCGPKCRNRVVQSGRTLPLEIFLTPYCGFGVRCPKSISRGRFIDIYLGEVLTDTELSRREEVSGDGAPSYVFALDWFIENEKEMWHIDGANFGSAMRFVNHSCEPNAQVITVASITGEKRLHYLAFFASRDIRAGEEIVIDYCPGLQALDPEELAKLDENIQRCKCGSARCRGIVWPTVEGKIRKSRKRLLPRPD